MRFVPKPRRLQVRARLALIVLLGASSVLASSAHGQKNVKMPPRPRLEAGKDTNDWRSYYAYGVEKISRWREDAANAFYWSARLNPTRAEPYYAQGLALLASNDERFLGYMFGIDKYVEMKEVQEADSLLYEGRRRNPFMQATLDKSIIEDLLTRLRGEAVILRTGNSAESQAYAAYNKGQMGLAATLFAEAADKDPKRLNLRVMRAHALAVGGDHDSAVVELRRVVDEMHKRDQKKLVSVYQSKAQFEYEIGEIDMMAGNTDAAKEAYGRALTEDLSFYLAHARLGELALAHGDTAVALAEYDQASQLRPLDGVAHFEYGVALLNAKQLDDATVQLRRAIELEPYFAPSYFDLAIVLDAQGKKSEAAEPFRQFIARAPRTLAPQVAIAKEKLAVITAVKQ